MSADGPLRRQSVWWNRRRERFDMLSAFGNPRQRTKLFCVYILETGDGQVWIYISSKLHDVVVVVTSKLPSTLNHSWSSLRIDRVCPAEGLIYIRLVYIAKLDVVVLVFQHVIMVRDV